MMFVQRGVTGLVVRESCDGRMRELEGGAIFGQERV
jgi:hypothetical protein